MASQFSFFTGIKKCLVDFEYGNLFLVARRKQHLIVLRVLECVRIAILRPEFDLCSDFTFEKIIKVNHWVFVFVVLLEDVKTIAILPSILFLFKSYSTLLFEVNLSFLDNGNQIDAWDDRQIIDLRIEDQFNFSFRSFCL